ncbi:soluble scavenger receptor cysteine-rich domain-containing protein SSC5D-like, partial [Cyprinus carpio]|uniref:Soluble scavenger receptor cysteine-rich domain-containing protein SSC5D-like n=1 Tax=Cyprinus carpio TaxID=7962 RepID=A0A9R0AU20_CYPCA
MNNALCIGSESTLKKCGSVTWGFQGVCQSKSAGVICSGVRLVGGSRCSGSLEILHNQTWMSVCDAAFDQQDAEVVCRELDCGAPVKVLGAAAFGKGDAQMWTQEIQCRGNESQIQMCPASQKHNCSHDDHQVLLCAGLRGVPYCTSDHQTHVSTSACQPASSAPALHPFGSTEARLPKDSSGHPHPSRQTSVGRRSASATDFRVSSFALTLHPFGFTRLLPSSGFPVVLGCPIFVLVSRILGSASGTRASSSALGFQ